jgi:hypothetical protein
MMGAAPLRQQQVSFEDVQEMVVGEKKLNTNTHTYILLNTLPTHRQSCLIRSTLLADQEESTMNQLLGDRKVSIVVYGENILDETPYKKLKQLVSLGFTQVYLYPGGLFEWLLLQDIYGPTFFPTIGPPVVDLLEYKPGKRTRVALIQG